MIKLATVSPCFNEEEGLAQSVAKLTDLFQALIAEGKIAPDSMIVLVNDGSRDKTWDIICQLHRDNPLVRGINLSHNAGHQNAIMAGMMTAKNWADAVITLDADLQDNYRKMYSRNVRCFLSGPRHCLWRESVATSRPIAQTHVGPNLLSSAKNDGG